MYQPNADQIHKAMELMGFDYIQARDHLVSAQRVKEIAQQRQALRLREALSQVRGEAAK